MPTHAPVITKAASRLSLTYLVSRHYRLVLVFAALAALYLLTVMLGPNDKPIIYQYDVEGSKARLLTLAVYVPYVLVWFVALVGYIRLREYVRSIHTTTDGAAFANVTWGIFCLTVWLPLSAVLTALTRAYYHVYPLATPLMVHINLYGNLLLLLVAVGVTYRGTLHLLRMVKQPVIMPLAGTLLYIAFAAAYTYLTFLDPIRQLPRADEPVATFYLPDWLTITTIIVPRLIGWFIGLQAAYNIYTYRRHVSGAIYREALTSLAVGLAGVIFLTIIFRSFQSVAALLGGLNVPLLILVIYGILLILSAGYMLMAQGAGKLHRFEKS